MSIVYLPKIEYVSILDIGDSVKFINRELQKPRLFGPLFGESQINPDWYKSGYRTHPDRDIRTPLVRSSELEALARQFFSDISRDPELLTRRAQLLLDWATQRKHPVNQRASLNLHWPV